MDKVKKNKMFYIGLAMLLLAGILLATSLFFYFKNKSKTDPVKTEQENSSQTESTQPTKPSTEGSATPEKPVSNPAPTPKTMTVKVFFGSTTKDPESIECGLVYATPRTINETVAVGRASLNELLKGTTEAEKTQGFVSSIPAGVVLKSLDIKNGVAYANFNEKLVAGGSCASERVIAQITQTLKQYPTVKSVVIQVNGSSEDVLQP